MDWDGPQPPPQQQSKTSKIFCKELIIFTPINNKVKNKINI